MNFNERLRELWTGLNTRQRVQIGVALGTTLALVWGFTLYANQIRYGVLFSRLAPDDAASIVAELKSKQVNYKTSAGGTIIEVPIERIDDLRMELAGEGLPPGSGVGFEIFDKPAFGLSNFVQGVNFQRALERELGRTIQSLDSVSSARVHLALAEESIFADEQKESSASVVVRLQSGRVMPKDSVRAIGNLVASGVEGLRSSNVSIIDGEGRMLTGGDDDSERMSETQYEAKREREAQIERTLLALLEPLVGTGRVRARANVDLNLTRIDRVEESYDPNVAVVRSELKKKSSGGDSGAASGVPGATANLPGAAGAGGGGASGQKSQSSETRFELNKTISTISEPVGTVARQTVAVVVDHIIGETTAEDGTVERTTTPRPPEEMQKIEELVRAAIGFDETRRDSLIVQNVPFEAPPIIEEPGFDIMALLPTILRYGSLPLAVLLLALFVIRPGIAAIRGLNPQAAAAGKEDSDSLTIGQLQAQLAGGAGGSSALTGASPSPMRQKLIEAIQEDPQAAALVVRTWMNHE